MASRRSARRRAIGLLLVATTAAALAHQLPVSSSSSAPAPPPIPPGTADGSVPDGATVFDDELPGVAKLDPTLLDALRRAATDAGADGVEFLVTSGWRSPEYQARLLQEAVSTYGSEQEAARWVATPETSPHVAGEAADLGSDGASWLSQHGTEYGLCQIYGNERWHYELRPQAVAHGCPPVYADPTQDPRMHQPAAG